MKGTIVVNSLNTFPFIRNNEPLLNAFKRHRSQDLTKYWMKKENESHYDENGAEQEIGVKIFLPTNNLCGNDIEYYVKQKNKKGNCKTKL